MGFRGCRSARPWRQSAHVLPKAVRMERWYAPFHSATRGEPGSPKRRNHRLKRGPGLNRDDHIVKVLSSLYEVVSCLQCGTRIRFGDFECPHCGRDVDDEMRMWAARLLDKLNE